jgi:hypothetical protein
MAPKGSTRPFALSEEYVVDSGDDQDEAHSEQTKNAEAKAIPEPPSKQRRSTKSNEITKRKIDGPSEGPRSTSETREEDGQVDGEADSEDDPEVTDLLDDTAKQASSKSSSGKERPRKKSKTTYASFSIPEKTLVTVTGLLLSAQYHRSNLTHLQASSNDLQQPQTPLPPPPNF